jgi:hypothetical protein
MVYERLARLGDQITVDDHPVLRPARTPFPEAERPGFTSELRRALRALAWPLILGVAFRVALMPFTSWMKDDSVWWLATSGGVQHIGLYQRAGFSYPPLWGDLLQGIGWLLQHLGATTSSFGNSDLRLEGANASNQFSTIVTSGGFNYCFKSILLLVDLGTGLLLYEVCRQSTGSEERSRTAFCLWFLNPFVIFATGVFGAFDVLVGFGVLASLLLLLSGRYAWSGIALGMAIMAKGSPIFVLPFFVFLIWDRRGDVTGRLRPSAEARTRALVGLAAGVFGTVVALVVPLVATHQLGAALGSVFARTAGAQTGGFSVFGLLEVRGLTGTWKAVNAWSGLGTAVLFLQVALAVVLGLVGTRRARRNLASSAFGTVALVLATVAVLGPLAAPQYALWFLPVLIAMVGIWRRGLASVVIFSAAPLLYLVVLYGPASVVFPLVERNWLSPAAMTHAVNTWNTHLLLPWSAGPGSTNAVAPIALLALVGLVVTARMVLHGPPPRRRMVEVIGRAAGGIIPALSVILVLALASAGVVAAARRGASVELHAAASPRQTAVTATVAPGSSLEQLRLVSFPLPAGAFPVRRVDVYVDNAYPVVESSHGTVTNTASDVGNFLRLHGYTGAVRTIDTQGLASLLERRSAAPSTALVDMAGMLPDKVFSKSRDLVSPWLRAGGTIYWGGAPIGYFTGRPGEPDDLDRYQGSLGPAGTARFLNPALLGYNANSSAVGETALPPARALSLRFRYVGTAPLGGPGVAGVSGVGWRSHGRASLSVVRVGQGQLVLFGGPIEDSPLVAGDVAVMVATGMTRSAGPFAYADVPASVVTGGGVVRWNTEPPPAQGHLAVVAIDPSAEGTLLRQTVVAP